MKTLSRELKQNHKNKRSRFTQRNVAKDPNQAFFIKGLNWGKWRSIFQ